MISHTALARKVREKFPETPVSTSRNVVQRVFREMADQDQALRPFRKHRLRRLNECIIQEAMDCHYLKKAAGEPVSSWMGVVAMASKRLAELDALNDTEAPDTGTDLEKMTPRDLQSAFREIMVQATLEGDDAILDVIREMGHNITPDASTAHLQLVGEAVDAEVIEREEEDEDETSE